jgi:RND superfamily putative drug exporter
LGVFELDQIEIWTLLFIFAVLFGLSMDYEVFIVSRIRESYLQSKDNNQAVIEGLANTGGVVTTAAIVMIGALTGFVTGHFAGLQELGIGLVAGIAIDATIIRLLLLPATMVLLGKWNWSHPRIRGGRTNS